VLENGLESRTSKGLSRMKLIGAAKRGLILALAGLIATAGAPTGFAKPRPPPVVEAPPPPPPMPDVGMARGFIAAAGAYDSYMREASSISPAFTDAGNVGQSLRTGVAYEPGQLRIGMVAYGAIAALTDSAFVADVRRAGATPEARYAIVARIYANPNNVLAFADARRAAGLAKAALASGGMRLFDNGNAVKQAAYAIQHQPWSLADVPDRDGRAAAVKKLSNAQRGTSGSETAALDLMIGGELPAGANLDAAPPPDTALVVRAVALAALAAIGQAGNDDAPRLGWLTDDYYVDHCLAEAKLSLFECLAVAKPNYEDVFCLGQHAMKDTATCVVDGVGSAVPIEIVPPALKIAPAHVRPIVRRKRKAR
jgi:hypothetical protein